MNSASAQPILIVIGASAGGLDPLMVIMRSLPAELPAAVCVTVHVPPTANSVLPKILERSGRLPAMHAQNGQRLEAGCVYVAPPDHHLLVDGDRIVLTRGPRENGHRPAIDPFFSTAARAAGQRVIGVILSGTLDDGVQGLQQVQRRGGYTIVQDPDEAVFDAMPRNTLAVMTPDYQLPAAEIGPALQRLAQTLAERTDAELEVKKVNAMSDPSPMEEEARLVAQDMAELERQGRSGQPSMLTCPDCGGVLWELQNGHLLRYRCHVGHAYSVDALRVAQSDKLEEALWTAVRSLEESAGLARRMATRARQANNRITTEHFEARAREDEARADLVRQALDAKNRPPGSLVAALDSGGNAE